MVKSAGVMSSRSSQAIGKETGWSLLDELHGKLGSRLGEVRELRKGFDDATLAPHREAFPEVRLEKPRKRSDYSKILGLKAQLVSAGLGAVRQFRPAKPLSRDFPQANLPAMDARWYHLAKLDSAIVSMPDGTSAAFYKRDPDEFRDLLRRTIELHERLYREWPALSARYREALHDVTSSETWESTFARSLEERG